MQTSVPPAPALDLPESVRAWARGRCDRVTRLRADGSVTLTMMLPGETLEATFSSATAAAHALETASAGWQPVSRDSNRAGFGAKRRSQ